MRRIVVASDLSERSDRAIERALRLSSELGAACRVVSIVDNSLPEDLASELKVSTEKRLRDLLDAHKGRQAEIDVRSGDIAAGVLGIAAETEADLLVLGLHRRRAFMDTVRETTVERIVALSRRPVLLVHDPVNAPYSRVLVPVSYSTACASAISAARRIAPEAELSPFHALHVPFSGLTGGKLSDLAHAVRRETEELAREWMATHAVSGEAPEIVAGSSHQVMDRMLQSVMPDLMAIGAHTRSGIGFHRIGAFAAELIREPPVDLLVTRA